MKNIPPSGSNKLIKQIKWLMPLALLGALCLTASCDNEKFRSRKTVATVNGEKIYLDEYRERLNAQKGILSPQFFPDSLKKQRLLEEEILESMITEKIVLQRARELNLSVSQTELDGKLMNMRKDYGDNFFDLLRAQNVRYESWREELKKEMLMDKLVAADVNARISVSEKEAENYFHAHPGACRTEMRIRALQIVVRDPHKAGEIKTRLDQGEDFSAVAARESLGPEASRGGNLGLIARRTLPEPLDKTLFKLPAGKISPIVRSAYGWHIFKVTEIHPAGTRSFADCRKDIMAGLRAQKEDAAFAAWLEELKLRAAVRKERTFSGG
jgi:parvulin-like peptidyl-prolyl isomerase